MPASMVLNLIVYFRNIISFFYKSKTRWHSDIWNLNWKKTSIFTVFVYFSQIFRQIVGASHALWLTVRSKMRCLYFFGIYGKKRFFTLPLYMVYIAVWYWNKASYDMIWYDMIWYDMVWYGMVWYDMIWYDMISSRVLHTVESEVLAKLS